MRTFGGGSAGSGDALLRRMAARRRRDNIAFGVLAVLAVLGGGNAILGLFDKPPPGPSDDTTLSIVAHSQLASSFASEFVVTYLGATAGQQDKVAKYIGGTQQITLPATGRQVNDPAVVFVERATTVGNLEVWSVTVSVRSASKTTTTTDAAIRQYYRVSIALTDGRMRALSLPAAVEPPGRGAELALAYSSSCAPDTPLGQVAAGFLAAYLTKNGDVTRYISSESGISALVPAPFTELTATAVTSNDSGCGATASEARVLASVSPKDSAGAAATLAYPLTLVRAGGQWQVKSVDPVPALANPIAVIAGNDSRGGPATTTTTTAPRSGSGSASVPPATHN